MPPFQTPVDPAALSIVEYPHPVLTTKATHVPRSDEATRAVAVRMLALMQQADGIGLAAPQVGLPWRMFVLHVPETTNADSPEPTGDDDPPVPRSADHVPPTATRSPRVYIDPRITTFEGPIEPYEEGCLSLPDIHGRVMRPPVIAITAIDEQGRPFTHRAGGLLARCIQHELDHLDGVLIIDRMLMADRTRNRKKIRALTS